MRIVLVVYFTFNKERHRGQMSNVRITFRVNRNCLPSREPCTNACTMRPVTQPIVDIGILTIRDDEFRAVLQVFAEDHDIYKGRHRESFNALIMFRGNSRQNIKQVFDENMVFYVASCYGLSHNQLTLYICRESFGGNGWSLFRVSRSEYQIG